MGLFRLATGLFAAVALAAPLTIAAPTPAGAQASEQFVPVLIYRTGPYAAGGTGIFGGMMDYMSLINERDGGVNGVKLTWEECETAYQNDRGVECYERLKGKGSTGASVVHPLSTGITYSLIARATNDKIPIISIGYGRTDASDGRVFPYVFPLITNYWAQNTAKIKFIGAKEGGMDKLKGKKIANILHDSAYGKETIPVLDKQSQMYGFEVKHFPVAHPGIDQKATWLQIQQYKPDWVILRGWGVMNPTALREASRIGFPANKIVGVWWAGSEEDVIPAGEAAKGYIAAGFHGAGRDYPVIQSILENVQGKGKGNIDLARVGTIYYNRGVVHGIVTVEAIRTAQEKYGKKPLTGEQIRWGIEHLNFDVKKIEALGARGLMPAFKISCTDHEGGGAVRFLQWSGEKWVNASGWIGTDQKIVRPMIEESAAKYAKEKNITPRDCSKEG
ncbi:MAG: ABC transporter substrate-binding protein [Rhodospirillales bacterium]|nr:ABC transporter substrate-binding protein [Rhodospirillales bacterium]